jgi:hypothetical protein
LHFDEEKSKIRALTVSDLKGRTLMENVGNSMIGRIFVTKERGSNRSLEKTV